MTATIGSSPLEGRKDGDPVQRFLNAARENEQSLDALLRAWRIERIVVSCQGGAGMAEIDDGARRIWGTLEAALSETASPPALRGLPCDWRPVCGYDLLHKTRSGLPGGRAVPKPFTHALAAEGEDLEISLLLFGAAGDWSGEIAQALVRGLRSGVDGKGGRKPMAPKRRSVLPLSVDYAALAETYDGPVTLHFLTPTSVRVGDKDIFDPFAVLKSLIARVSGMALWHGISIQPDIPGLLDAAAQAAARAEPDLREARSAGRRRGFIGSMTLPPCEPALFRILRLGEAAHAGARCAEGRGRYALKPAA